MRRRLPVLMLALALLLGTGACGGGGSEAPQEEDLSVVVIQVTFTSNVPTMYQVQVRAHFPGLNDSVLMFPNTKTDRPIQSGDTMALLLPTTLMGMLDLTLSGLDGNGTAVARGNGQARIAVNDRSTTTILLEPL